MNPTNSSGPVGETVSTPQNTAPGSSYPGQAGSPSNPTTVGVPKPTPVPQPGLPLQTNDVLAAEDRDLIERSWVEKAKHIVNHTKGDPFEQSRQLTSLKVEYMKKRYNKDVRQDD